MGAVEGHQLRTRTPGFLILYESGRKADEAYTVVMHEWSDPVSLRGMDGLDWLHSNPITGGRVPPITSTHGVRMESQGGRTS